MRYLIGHKPINIRKDTKIVKGLNLLVSDEIFERILDILGQSYDSKDCQNENAIRRDPLWWRDNGMIPLLERDTKAQFVFDFLQIPKKFEYISIVRSGDDR